MRNNLSDSELIGKILAGDKPAYAGLVARHQRFVFTLALRFVRSREDAEEIAQDSFIKAFRFLNNFKQNSKFSTWLYSIVYTTAMTHLRKKRPDVYLINDGDGSAFFDIASEQGSDKLEHKSKMAYVNLAINELFPGDAAIITLFYQGEQSLEEIGRQLSMETKTVKVKLHRARLRLKDKLTSLLAHEVGELL